MRRKPRPVNGAAPASETIGYRQANQGEPADAGQRRPALAAAPREQAHRRADAAGRDERGAQRAGRDDRQPRAAARDVDGFLDAGLQLLDGPRELLRSASMSLRTRSGVRPLLAVAIPPQRLGCALRFQDGLFRHRRARREPAARLGGRAPR